VGRLAVDKWNLAPHLSRYHPGAGQLLSLQYGGDQLDPETRGEYIRTECIVSLCPTFAAVVLRPPVIMVPNVNRCQ
jgi:hypothetical protein